MKAWTDRNYEHCQYGLRLLDGEKNVIDEGVWHDHYEAVWREVHWIPEGQRLIGHTGVYDSRPAYVLGFVLGNAPSY